jgi:hypothetical protein
MSMVSYVGSSSAFAVGQQQTKQDSYYDHLFVLLATSSLTSAFVVGMLLLAAAHETRMMDG